METSPSVAVPLTTAPNSRVTRWKKILAIAWPLIVANSFWNLQLTTDRIFLGHFSTEALGAAMAVMGIFWTPMALLQQTASYLMTFVAQYFGAKQEDRIGPALWQAIYISLIGGTALLFMIPFSDSLFAWIGHSGGVQKLESEYFKSLCYSGLPTALVAVASGFYTGLGNTRVIMGINCVALIANTVFAYVMIFGKFGFPALGVAGAGYATALANCVAAAYGLWLVFGKKNEATYKTRSSWRYDGDLMKRFVRYGIPSGMQWALEGLAFTLFLIVVGRMNVGDAALASSGIVVTVMMLSVLPAMGVAQAGSVLVGQHLGSKNPEQAAIDTISGLQIAMMYIVTVGITFLLFPSFYLSWFHNPENAPLWSQVSEMVPYLLMYVAFFTCFDSMNLVFSFALKGAGDTKFVTWVALLLPWPVMVIPTWLMRDWPNAVYWAWGAASCYSVIQAMIFLARFRGGKWKSMSVIH